jgi:sugar phosphate isomerase/epimerase
VTESNSPRDRAPATPGASFVTRRAFLGAVTGTVALTALGCARGGAGADTTVATGTAAGTAGSAGAAGAATGASSGSAAPGSIGLGVQLYTLREALGKDLDGTLGALAGMGYRNVEPFTTFGRPAADFRAALDKHGLRAPSMHFPITALRADAAQVFRDAQVLGVEWVIIPWLDTAERNLAGYRKVGGELKQCAAQAPAGVRVGYHNHEFEFAKVDGERTGMDVLAEASGPQVGLELDLFWTVKAGHEPLAFAKRHPNRVMLVHAKDAGPAPERKMTDVGAGTIDFRGILTELKAGGLKWAFVEHDEPTDALATVRAGLTHLTSLKL